MARHLDQVNKCPVCRSYADNSLITPTGPDIYRVNCWRCGVFRISGTVSVGIAVGGRSGTFTQDQRATCSSFIRENQEQLLTEADIDFVRRMTTPGVPEKAIKLLRFIAKQYPYPGQGFHIAWANMAGFLNFFEGHTAEYFGGAVEIPNHSLAKSQLPLFAASWSRNAREFQFLLETYLKEASGFIDKTGTIITPEGWNHLASLEAAIADSETAFVAMWFNEKTNALWSEAILPGVYGAGYEPIRIDRIEHSNKIDDEIIARIRECKFLVADFTDQRGGVYYEAGFAKGLGKQVVWSVKEEDLKNVHFDNRQFNFLLWNDNSLPAFRDALTARIESIFGKGPVKVNAGGNESGI